jgi:hypothetical protein
MKEISTQLNVDHQYPGNPQNSNSQRHSQKPVCCLVCPFGKPQKMIIVGPMKIVAKERSIIKGDLERIWFQVIC